MTLVYRKIMAAPQTKKFELQNLNTGINEFIWINVESEYDQGNKVTFIDTKGSESMETSANCNIGLRFVPFSIKLQTLFF